MLSSTVITIDSKTLKERLETSLAREFIISNNDSDDDKSDTEVINQDNPVIVNNEEMAVVIPNSQQVSLRDALEVVPLLDGSNLPLSHFIEGCMEAKAMLPTPAAQENLARLLRGKLTGEARKCIFGSTYAAIEELIEKLKRVYAPAKSVYQLQGELGNTFTWDRENVLSYAARIKEIADRIEDSHRLNNGGQVDNAFKQNVERDVVQCFIRGLLPELEVSVEEKDAFREVINDSIDIERRLAANFALRKNKNMECLKSEEQTNNKNNKVTRFDLAREDKFVCLICKKPGHTTEKCFHLSKAQDTVLNNKQQNFSYPNQQRYNNLNGERSNNNNFSRSNYDNIPNNFNVQIIIPVTTYLQTKNYNFNNNNNLQNRNNN